ncbi:peptide chain release factor 2 [Candidatus Saccharibacteria bacterium]|nr:peptide chain release factor 2 [Candidatus Saccharibacteria bacterium]
MHNLTDRTTALIDGLAKDMASLDVPALTAQAEALEAELAKPEAWNDPDTATRRSQDLAKLRARITPWQELAEHAAGLRDLLGLNDASLADDITAELVQAETRYAGLRRDLLFSGPYDDHDAILSLHAGAGGVDAMDWTGMLLRMYVRWAEDKDFKTEVIEQSNGEEAGIKSVTLAIRGAFAYGRLRSEHGVHRLVRLSPFNSDNLRQTSFALVEVLPAIDSPEEVAIDDKDLRIDVFRAGGHGGQSVNTTDSAVRITHMPTGIVVAIQNERSQLQNKATAMGILRARLAAAQMEQHAETLEQLRGPSKSAEWGSQIRNYVLHPYTLVKDARTKYEEHDAAGVLDGRLDGFIDAYLEAQAGEQ